MKYELSIAVRMSHNESLTHMNRHSYYIVTITSEILHKNSRAYSLQKFWHV